MSICRFHLISLNKSFVLAMNSSNQNNPSQNNPTKKGKGRQKVNMAKIENETNLQVTFSKRRAGLFKKASELSTLCGAESAVVVFSPGEKVHSFGNPSVETVCNRFLNQDTYTTSDTSQLLAAQKEATMRQYNQELINLEGQLELEKKRKQQLDKTRKASRGQKWGPPSTDELDYHQLDQLKRSIMSFKRDFETKVQTTTNSYVEGSNLDAGRGGTFQWTTPNVANSGFPFDSNIQGPNDRFTQFESNEAMFTNNAPLALGGSRSAHHTMLDGGNSNAAIPNSSGTNGSGFVPAFDPRGGNFGFAVQYPPPTGSGPDFVLPYSYGSSGDVVPYDARTRSSSMEPHYIPREAQSNVLHMTQGFSGNYGR